MPDLQGQLHLVKVPLRPEKLALIARHRLLPLRDLDDGYLCHCVLRELWQERAPAPFVIRGHGPSLAAWGYSVADAASLIDHARAFAAPDLLAVLGDVETVASKPMPVFDTGRRVGFLLRACPIARLGRGAITHRPGAEVDVFLARTLGASRETIISREDVYREWLLDRLNRSETTGVRVDALRLAGFSRERLIRRSQGPQRQARTLQRPDVRFEGDLVVVDGHRFNRWLLHGVGRHRAFGFGALILVPPGMPQQAGA